MHREARLAICGLWAALVLAVAAGAAAQEPSPQRPGPAPRNAVQPQEEGGPRIPVSVEHAGADPIGTRLAFALKETFSKSPLFRVTTDEEKKISVRVTTRAEFADRPGLASGWSVVWLFTEQSDVLGFYLESDMGFADRDAVADAAVSLASRTEEVARRFSYLFE